MATSTKSPQAVRSKSAENSSKINNHQENSNPNLSSLHQKSPSVITKSASKTQKSAPKNPNPNPNPAFASPKKKIRERKFVVISKKNNNNNNSKNQSSSNLNCKCKNKINGKCLCVAYENLRASQEDFFKSRSSGFEGYGDLDRQEEDIPISQNLDIQSGLEKEVEENDHLEAAESPKGLGNSTIKRRRDILLEEARESVPEPGSGRVMHLVKAFERLLTIPKESNEKDEKEAEDTKKGLKWVLPGLQQPPPRAPETQESSSAFCPGELFFTAESLGFDSHVGCSLDSGRGSNSSRSSGGSVRSRRRSSSFSSGTAGGRKWKKKKQQKITSLRPFKLRTEQRGKVKEEEFVKKLQELMTEEEKQRIPIAQGLPWTTDEPECLIKPPVKECTKPVDLKLHTDMRAVERADFDYQVHEKMMLIEQYKMERERQQKLEEEEEIRRLRKELVPKAQPMPYFDRPFIPRRSAKQPTIPKEPKFHVPPQQKKIKCCVSWNDFSDYIHT